MGFSTRYLNYWIVMVSDIIVSAVCTLIACFAVRFILKDQISPLFDSYYFLFLTLFSAVVSGLSFYLFKTYRNIIRYTSIREIGYLGLAASFKVVGMLLVTFVMKLGVSPQQILLCTLIDLTLTFLVLVGMRVCMIMAFDIYNQSRTPIHTRKQVLIYGVNDAAVGADSRMRNDLKYNVVGFCVHSKKMENYRLAGKPVYYFHNEDRFQKLLSSMKFGGIIFPSYNALQGEKERLVRYCEKCSVQVLIVPPMGEFTSDLKPTNMVREINIEDLLDRDVIDIDMAEVKEAFFNKTVLVTGAAGSIGSELCRQLATLGIQRLILFDNAETPTHLLKMELIEKFPYLRFVPVIGDTRDKERLEYVFHQYQPNVVFHAAAYKHVPMMEDNPCEAITVNVEGTRHVADLCLQYKVERMIMISTDKAVNPTNIMGASKRMAEIYVQSLGMSLGKGKTQPETATRFITTRFGNVLGSNGSVVPLFREQINHGGPVTVTHPDITRFFMTIPEACRLVLEAATMGEDSEIFVFDMGKPVRIADMAKRMVELAGYIPDVDIKIQYIGLRPGEKLYEEVLSNEENTRPTENRKIRIANARTYDYAQAAKSLDAIVQLAHSASITEMLRCIRALEPEYIAQNTWLEKI